VLGADVIAGFPTEDESKAERTLAFIEEAGLDLLHVFPFSPRPGTPAARMPQVAKSVVRERAARLRATGDAARRLAFERVVGKTVSALVEQPGLGRSEHYLPVRLPPGPAEGEVRELRIVSATDRALVAEGSS